MTRQSAMPKVSKSALTPKLRFPEFRNDREWEQRILGDEGEFLSPLTGKSAEHFGVGEAKYITYMNVLSNTFADMNSLGTVDVRDYERQNRILRGDVLFTVSSETPDEAGMSSVVLEERDACYLNSFCTLFRFFEHKRPNSRYIGYFLRQPTVRKYLSERAQGSTRYNLSKAAFRSLPILVPSPAEQQKIAECLSTLDELIEAESRKLDALRDYKKGLMQQLFPREGETRPRLRFPEFRSAPEWETDKLGSVCDLYQPVTLSSAELSMTGEYLVYGANGIIGSHNQYNHEDSEIAVTCRGATCGEVTKTKPKSWITGNAMVIKPKSQSLSKDFIFHYFKNHGLKSVISGSAQPQITRAGFSPLVVSFPKPDEQHRIATCLNSLDELIAAQSDRISALQTHKQGLLQQLFP